MLGIVLLQTHTYEQHKSCLLWSEVLLLLTFLGSSWFTTHECGQIRMSGLHLSHALAVRNEYCKVIVTVCLLRDHSVNGRITYPCIMCKPWSRLQHPGWLRCLSRILGRQSRTGFSCVTFLVIRTCYAAGWSRSPVWVSDTCANELLAFPKTITTVS